MIGVYIRISTTGQNEAGQRREIEKWLENHGLEGAWYIDRASGDSLDRPEFSRLQSDIFAGKIRTVVVWKLDRLSRSLRDGIVTISDWVERGVRVVSTTQQIDLTGTVGRMIAAVLLAVAEMEQETRRERQAAGIAVAKERGVYRGRKAGSSKVDPAKVKELRSRGMSASEIASILRISRASVYRLC